MKTGIYLHIPFCRARCTYCDFNTYVGLDDLVEPYVCALHQEIIRHSGTMTRRQGDRSAMVTPSPAKRHPVIPSTVFFGGGTPSLLKPEWVGNLIRACGATFDMPKQVEITVECNPGTVNRDYLHELRAQGVNRLSFGAQSANPAELKLLGREHDWPVVATAFEAARNAGFDNVNLDLIFGLPYQALPSWQRTVHEALALHPDHISLYALTIESGTPMHDWTRRGELPFPDPDLAADMYDHAEQTLGAQGLIHYEISNWCRPGRACEHNLIYWRNEPYYGLGAGAHGSTIVRRRWNVRQPREYITRVERGETAEMNHEDIDERTSRGETMMLGLRLLQEGVTHSRFAERYGAPPSHFYERELAQGQHFNLLEVTDERVRLTERGHFLSNQVMRMFV